jgi:hypothetical protein
MRMADINLLSTAYEVCEVCYGCGVLLPNRKGDFAAK